MGRTVGERGGEVYSRRWWVLLLFSLHAMYQVNICLLLTCVVRLVYQCTVWNTWGPVERAALLAYPTWTTATVSTLVCCPSLGCVMSAVQANWGNYVLFPAFLPCMWAVHRSLRGAVLLGSGLMAVATSLRCLVVVPGLSATAFTVICHTAAALNGVSGIIFCSAPPALSAAWFPAGERVTATSIGQTFNGLGNGLVFLIARLMVPSPEAGAEAGAERQQLTRYLLLLAGPPLLLLALAAFYFPSAPPRPPSRQHHCTAITTKFYPVLSLGLLWRGEHPWWRGRAL